MGQIEGWADPNTPEEMLQNPKNKGIGLAAPQVGVNKRIIVVGLPNNRDEDRYSIILMINPSITRKSDEKNVDEE